MIKHAQLENNVDEFVLEDARRIIVVGTAHVSKDSTELVERAIRQFRPDTVALELCAQRYESINDPNKWRDTDLFKVIRSGKAYVLLAQLALASFQKRIADRLEVKPGDEMRRAIAVSSELGLPIVCVDREIKVTLRRVWFHAPFFRMFRLLSELVGSLFDDKATDISAETIEGVKHAGELSELLDEFSKTMPHAKSALIDERDRYMATKLLDVPGKTVVAVVGAAHVPGMRQFFGQRADLAELDIIPSPRLISRLLLWTVPALILGMIAYGLFSFQIQTSADMLLSWVLISGLLAAGGALLALAHPLTIAAAFIASPLIIVRVGWLCGLVEAFLRKPRVLDFEQIGEDITTFRGWRQNRVTKILLVMMLANLGALTGRILGGFVLASFFGSAVH